MRSLIHARDAAEAIPIPYQTLMSRIRRGQLAAVKIGPSVFIEEGEVRRHAGNQDMVDATRKVFLSEHSTEGTGQGPTKELLVREVRVPSCRKKDKAA